MNIADNILKRSIQNINTNEVDVVPCNRNVIVEFYRENPYRTIETTSEGLILGVESTKNTNQMKLER